jgi:hypothetical protein
MRKKVDRRKLTQLPETYLPDFLERMNKNLLLGRAIKERRSRIENESGGAENLDLTDLDTIDDYVWHGALVEHNKQRLAAGRPIDQAVYNQLVLAKKTLKLVIDGFKAKARSRAGKTLREFMDGGAAA